MGKTRESANLVSDNNIKVDIDNDRVGIGTSAPAYDLDVVGDVNFSGTLYQNGTEFTSGVGIQSTGTVIGSGITQLNFIGAGNTFALNGSTVDISIAGGSGGAGLSTTGFSTAYGLHIDPVGSGVTYAENLVVVGNARVTGILSIGTSSIVLDASDNSIRLSSDTVIRRDESTGDVRFLDSSGNLKKIVANEIRIGTGNSVSILRGGGSQLVLEDSEGATSTIISGGGGGDTVPAIYDDETINNDDGWTGNTTYSCCMRTAGGKKGNTFFFARLEQNSSITDTRLRVYPFTVDRSTGVITWGSASNVWLNTSGSGFSTTYWTGPDGTGAVFAGGNNQIPGYSSHVFSYSKFIVNANGTLSDTGYSYTNADHGYNGVYYSLPTAINTGYFSSAGYNANASSRAYYRQHYMNGSSISVGSLTNLSSDTSTSYSVGMIAQPGVYQSGNQVVSMIYYRINSSNYRVRATSANGNYSDHAVSNWASGATAYQMTNGDVILYSSAHATMRFTAYNSKTDLTTANALPGSSSQFSSFMHFGLGNNEFVLSLSTSSPVNFGFPLVKATLNSTTGFSISGVSPVVNPVVALGMESSYTGLYPLYANANDANPDKLLIVRHHSGYIRAKVIDFPTFTAVE